MKIVVIHQYYLLPGEPGGSRFNEMARFWSQAGHQVTVVGGTLNYAAGEAPSRFRRRWVTKEREGNIAVWRCHVPGSYRRSYAGRMWAFFCFSMAACTAALLIRDADVVIATSPPLTAALPGWIAARLRRRRIPWIFEIRDLWPESAITTGVLGRGALLTRGLYALEAWACRRSNLINVLTPAFLDDIVARGLAPASKVVFIPNGADLETFEPGPRQNAVRSEFGWGNRCVVMYAGAHGRANALGQLLDAAERLRHRPDILIACVGDGPERAKLEQEAKNRHLQNIQFCGPQPKERMPDFVNACDIGAAVLQRNPTFRTVYPNKVFDYMACARPTLLAIDGVARELVCERAQAGMFAEPENGTAIAGTILEMADNRALREEMGLRGRRWVLENASREVLAQRYLEIMKDLTSKRLPAILSVRSTAEIP